MHSNRIQTLLLSLLFLLLALTSSVLAAPTSVPGPNASLSPKSTYQVPKSLPIDVRRSALKLLTRLTTRIPRTVDLTELRLLLASSPSRTRQSIRSNVGLAVSRLIPAPATEQERATARIGRALDGLVSKRARKERRRVEALSKRGRREEARRRVRGLVKAAARARKGLRRRLMGERKVGRWTAAETRSSVESGGGGGGGGGEVLVMPLSGKKVKKSNGDGKGWNLNAKGRRMVKGIIMAHRHRAPAARRAKRAVVDYADMEGEEEMETDV